MLTKSVMKELNKEAKEKEDLGKKMYALLTEEAKRRNQNWGSKKWEQLQAYWNEVERNHEELKTVRTVHKYFAVISIN